MNTSKKIRRRIKAKNALELFSFDNIVKENESHTAVSKELSRMCSKGEIKRLKNGVYYKPKMSKYGEITPSERQIIIFLSFNKNKQVGYISGERLYNNLGLTSQVSGIVTIATNEERRSGEFAGLRVRYVKAYGRVDKDNVRLMQILDTIKDVDKILDTSVEESLTAIYHIIQELSAQEKKDLVRIAKNYPSRVIAILGAMMSNIWKTQTKNRDLLESLRSEIPNTTKFDYPNSHNILNNARDWNIYDTTRA
jgi:predicted transcriptional regulator of viral defense system